MHLGRTLALCAALSVAVVSAACASTAKAPTSTSTSTSTLDVVVDARAVFHGPAAYTVRVAADASTLVVSLPRIGEVIVGDATCRFARLEAGGAVAVWRHEGACAHRMGSRLCFARAAFVDDAAVMRGVVDGCVEQNEIFLDRMDGVRGAVGVGPRTLIERCADVPARDPGYVAVVDINVDDNEQPWRGMRLRYDGDAFGVCFLSRPTGRYRIDVVVEDPRRRTFVLAGAVDEL
jgi:hypothetical protein